ncbi:MAG TPA: OsmC family protein [Usitatibacter sp.]
MSIVELHQDSGYRFANRFGPDLPVVYSDEPQPLGTGTGPSPMQLLAAAVGNCLCASLLFALKKFKQSPEPIEAVATATEGRNEQKRLRVLGLHVRITLGVPAARLEHLDRALEQFEEFCTVTQSVRQGIPVAIEVYDSEGARLK